MREISLVHSGGGTKGAVEVGATWYLYASPHRLTPTFFTGTSVGALNVTKLAEGTAVPLSGRVDVPRGTAGIEGLWRIWRDLRAEIDLMVPLDGLANVMKDIAIEDLVRESSLMAAIAGHVPASGVITGDFEDDVANTLAGVSLYSLQPMKNLVNDPSVVDMRRVAENLGRFSTDGTHRLVVNFVDSRSGELLYGSFDIQAMKTSGRAVAFVHDRDSTSGRLRKRNSQLDWADAVLATSAIPGIVSTVRIDGVVAYDGGIREVTALGPSLAQRVRTVVALTGPAFGSRNFDPSRPHPLFPMMAPEDPEEPAPQLLSHLPRTIDLLVDQNMLADVAPREGLAFEGLWHTRPEIDVIGTFNAVPARIRLAASYGAEMACADFDPVLRNNTARSVARTLASAKAFSLAASIAEQSFLEASALRLFGAGPASDTWRELFIANSQFVYASGYKGLGSLPTPPKMAEYHQRARQFDRLLQDLVGRSALRPVDTDLGRPWFDLGDFRVHGPSDDSEGDFPPFAQKVLNAIRSRPLSLPSGEPPPDTAHSAIASRTELWTWRSASGSLQPLRNGNLAAEFGRSALAASQHRDDCLGDRAFELVNDDWSVRYGQQLSLTTLLDGRPRRFIRQAHEVSSSPWRHVAELKPFAVPQAPVLGFDSVPLPYGLCGGVVDLLTIGAPNSTQPTGLCIQPDRAAQSLSDSIGDSVLASSGLPGACWWDAGVGVGVDRIRILVAVPNGSTVTIHQLDEHLKPVPIKVIELAPHETAQEVSIGQVRRSNGTDSLLLLLRIDEVPGHRIEQRWLDGPPETWTAAGTNVLSSDSVIPTAGPCFLQLHTGELRVVYGAETPDGRIEVFLTGRDGQWTEQLRREPTIAGEPVSPTRYGLSQVDDGHPRHVVLYREGVSQGGPMACLEYADGTDAFGQEGGVMVEQSPTRI